MSNLCEYFSATAQKLSSAILHEQYYRSPPQGITIKIRAVTTVVKGRHYCNYTVPDYTTGVLVRHTRASLGEAREKAKELCGLMSTKTTVLMSRAMARALEILSPSHLAIDRAAQVITEALKHVKPDLIVEACRWPVKELEWERIMKPSPDLVIPPVPMMAAWMVRSEADGPLDTVMVRMADPRFRFPSISEVPQQKRSRRTCCY